MKMVLNNLRDKKERSLRLSQLETIRLARKYLTSDTDLTKMQIRMVLRKVI